MYYIYYIRYAIHYILYTIYYILYILYGHTLVVYGYGWLNADGHMLFCRDVYLFLTWWVSSLSRGRLGRQNRTVHHAEQRAINLEHIVHLGLIR